MCTKCSLTDSHPLIVLKRVHARVQREVCGIIGCTDKYIASTWTKVNADIAQIQSPQTPSVDETECGQEEMQERRALRPCWLLHKDHESHHHHLDSTPTQHRHGFPGFHIEIVQRVETATRGRKNPGGKIVEKDGDSKKVVQVDPPTLTPSISHSDSGKHNTRRTTSLQLSTPHCSFSEHGNLCRSGSCPRGSSSQHERTEHRR